MLNELNMKKKSYKKKLQLALNVYNIKELEELSGRMFSINWFVLPNHLGSNKIRLHSVIMFALTPSSSIQVEITMNL